MENKKSCVIYARYSSNNQREISAEEQVRYCTDFANLHNIQIKNIYVDKALTGKYANRYQFQKMIEFSKTKSFDYVIVYSNNRFARNRQDKSFYKGVLAKNKVVILYATQEFLNTNSPDAIIHESIDDGISEWYSANLSREVMNKGLLPNARKCLHNGGKPPLGLDVVNQHYIVNKDEAKVVKMIFNWYANCGYSYKHIAKELNVKGYLNKYGREFKDTSIRDLLLNEKYIGTYVYNRRASADSLTGTRNNSKEKPDDEVIRNPNAFEAIIDIETFDKVKKVMQSRKGRNASYQAKEVYLLSGIVKCGKCKGNLSGNRKPSNRDGSHHVTYSCNTRKKQGTDVCNMKEINKTYLESAIIHYILSMCDGENFDKIFKEVKKLEENLSDIKGAEKDVEKRLRKIDKEVKNIISAIKGGFDADELKDEWDELKKQQKLILTEQEKIKDSANQQIKINEKMTKEALLKIKSDIENKKPIEEYKQMFGLFVNSVEIYEDYVEIVLNFLNMWNVQIPYDYHQIGKKRPPLELNQEVVWRGGDDEN